MSDLLALMKKFRKAYAMADKDGLLASTSDDFEWHQHVGSTVDDLPTGRILRGIDASLPGENNTGVRLLTRASLREWRAIAF